MLDQTRIDQLWRTACADAGYSPEDPLLVLASSASVEREERNAYYDPSAEPEAKYLPLTERELEHLRAGAGRHRIVVASDANEPQMLALMRWSLEHAVQYDHEPGLMQFHGYTLDILSITYRDLGAGSALMAHLIPTDQDANAAAARLVTKTLGVQLGQLAGPFGALYHPAESASLESLPKRMVSFVALHGEAFQTYAGGGDAQRDMVLRHIDGRAPAWWAALMHDSDFGHFRALVPYFVPTPDEIAAAPAPVAAWRPLAELLRRGQARGLQVLGSVA